MNDTTPRKASVHRRTGQVGPGRFRHMIPALLLWAWAGVSHAALNGAVTGAWFDPAFEGAGFLVEVLPEDRAVVYWFTYDDSGAQQWYIGVGTTTDTTIVIDDLQVASGGRFGPGFEPDTVSLRTVGHLNLSFDSCAVGTADYAVDGQAGTQSLSRLIGIRDFPCQSLDDASPAEDGLHQTASWFSADRSGEGFIVEVINEDLAFINWFTYDDDGNPAWYSGTAHVAGESIVVPELLITSGGRFGPEHDPSNVNREMAGRLELYLGCDTGRVNYDMSDGRPSGGHDLVRLTEIQGLHCDHDRFGTATIDQLFGQWRSEGFGVAAEVTSDEFRLYQLTAESCLIMVEGPIAGLEAGLDDIRVNQHGDRLELEGLDAVTPVFLDRVNELPQHCASGGTSRTTDPQHNYDVFAATYAELYAAFPERNVDWSAQQAVFGPQVTASMSSDALFDLFSQMLAPLVDRHTTVRSPTRFFGSGATPEVQAYFQRAQGFAVGNIVRTYLDTPRLGAVGGTLAYGATGSGIGYLEIRSFDVNVGGSDGDQQLAFYREELDRIFRFYEDQDVNRLILDVRRNEGGDSAFAMELANRLLRGQPRTLFTERRRVEGGWSSAHVAELAPGSGLAFDGDVVLLTGSITGSAAEIFTLAIRALPHATLIGEPTAGVLSRTERILPNGWTVSLTVGQIATPDGAHYEALGIPPDLLVPVYSDDDFSQGRDSALEAAIDHLGDD